MRIIRYWGDKRRPETKPRRDREENGENWPGNRPMLWVVGGQAGTPSTWSMLVGCWPKGQPEERATGVRGQRRGTQSSAAAAWKGSCGNRTLRGVRHDLSRARCGHETARRGNPRGESPRGCGQCRGHARAAVQDGCGKSAAAAGLAEEGRGGQSARTVKRYSAYAYKKPEQFTIRCSRGGRVSRRRNPTARTCRITLR